MSKIMNQVKKYIVNFAALIFNILLWLWLVIFIQPTGESQVLHYNIYFGIDHIGSGLKLYLLPLFGLIIIAINLLFNLAKGVNKQLSIYAAWLSVIVQLFLIISLLFLIINYY